MLTGPLNYWLLRGQPESYQMGILTFITGLLLCVIVDEMARAAHVGDESRRAVLILLCSVGYSGVLGSQVSGRIDSRTAADSARAMAVTTNGEAAIIVARFALQIT